MNKETLLATLHRKGIKLWLEDDALRFKAPKGALTPDLKARLIELKPEIIAFFQGAKKKAAKKVTIQPAPRDGNPPLSFAQQRLWFLEQLEGENASYVESGAFRIEGRLNVPLFKRALGALVQRHESLRTGFVSQGGVPAQMIEDHPRSALNIVDASGLDPSGHEAFLETLALDEALIPFQLTHPPLLRLTLVPLQPQRYALLITLHHIVSDAWSFQIFVQELAVLYASLSQNKPAPLPPLPIQYADFAIWQRAWLSGEELNKQLNYWKDQLEGLPPLLSLPLDRPRPAVQSFAGSSIKFFVDADKVKALSALGQKHDATPFMVLLAAFSTLLARYSGQNDVAVGTPVANRNREELEGLIGFLVNMLVMRSGLHGNPSFAELLKATRTTALEAYAHQDLPFEQVVNAVQPDRNLSYSPLFQVMFILQNAPMAAVQMPDFKLTPLPVEKHRTKFDLMLSMMETEQGLHSELVYASDLFDRRTMDRFIGHFNHLLDWVLAHPQLPLSQFSLLDQAEAQQILVDWNQTKMDYEPLTVPRMFKERAHQTPDAPALYNGGDWIGYGDLKSRVNRFANHLRSLGVGPGSGVGVCVKRSPDMVTALLAVMDTGATYVPIDPDFPAQRVAFMIEDAALRILITEQDLLARLPETRAVMVFLNEPDVWAQGSDADGPTAPGPGHLAYMIYTSGSSGKPKGVCVSHQALTNFLLTMGTQPGLSDGDTLAAVTTISFDIAGLELYLPLISGARLAVVERDVAVDGRQLMSYLLQTGATAMQATPATWRLLLAAGWKGDPNLKILCGGEALPAELAASLSTMGHSLWNLYGPTETTIWSTLQRIEPGVSLEDAKAPAPIGKPIANTSIYLLDRFGNPVPAGVAAELHIGGDGVANGYHERAALTAEKFIPDPHGGHGARCYKTGDLARYRSDGSLAYIGRMDDQIKLRGFRIELGEIETVLAKHPAVEQAVAVVAEDTSGEKRLLAYVREVPGSEVTDGEYRDQVGGELAEYMIPSGFMRLESFPLTPNGKVNRKALPAFDQAASAVAYVAPATPTEERLAAIWEEVLETEGVGTANSFFELGGHSLLAMRMLARIEDTFNLSLSVRNIFQTPTIALLAAHLDKQTTVESGPPLVPAPEGEAPVPSFAQERLLFMDHVGQTHASYNISGYLKLTGDLDQAVLERALSEILVRHRPLRSVFTFRDGKAELRENPPAPVALALEDFTHLSSEESAATARRLAFEEAAVPFDLGKDVLMRCRLLKLAPQTYELLMVIHHIVSDAWSLGVLMNEVSQLYAAYKNGNTSPLPPLAIHYADFARWQRQWLDGQRLEDHLTYWEKRLKDPPSPTRLPSDYRAGENFDSASVSLIISSALRDKVNLMARQHSASSFMILLAVFKLLLFRLTGERDVMIGSPVAGRNHRDLEGLIGFFINTLVLRVKMDHCPSFLELVDRVREVTLESYQHDALPFEKLVAHLQPQRAPGELPFVEILFNMINTPQGEVNLPGLVLETGSLIQTEAKMPLMVSVQEREDGMMLLAQYRAALYSRERIEGVLQQFRFLLEQVLAEPNLALTAYSLRYQDASAPNPAVMLEHPSLPSLESLFLEQARKAPGQTAIFHESGDVDYTTLSNHVNGLKVLLSQAHAGPGRVTALYGRRSPGWVTAVMAVIFQGGILLTVDPDLPRRRNEAMLRDSGADLVLVMGPEPPDLDVDAPVMNLCPQSGASLAPWNQRPAPQAPRYSKDAAYIIYTSGTTGQPKGVLGSVHGLTQFIAWQRETFNINPEDRCAQLTEPFVDVIFRDIFTPLTAGAAVCLPPGRDALAPSKLLPWMNRAGITFTHTVPTIAASWVSHGGPAPQSLRLLLTAGEPVTGAFVERWREAFGEGCELVNLYGATETSLARCYYVIPAENRAVRHPAGHSIPHNQLLVLSSENRLCGPGEPGELVFHTPFPHPGYVNRPDETQARFTANFHLDRHDPVFYRTGDLGCYRYDGAVDVLGREDDQVKIRGMRIELGEIEACLDRNPMVRENAVIMAQDSRNRFLVGFTVMAEDAVFDGEALTAWLRERLVPAMIPSRLIPCDTLPLTATGKRDRRALNQLLMDQGGAAESEPTLPVNDVEAELCALWARLLEKDHVNTSDNFFQLGGHSLLVMELAAQIEARFNATLPPAMLFEKATPGQQAREIETVAQRVQDLPTLAPAPRDKTIPLSFAQQRLWLVQSMDPENTAFNVSIMVRLSGDLQTNLLVRCFEDIARRHEILRTRFTTVNGEQIQIVDPQPQVEAHVCNLTGPSIQDALNQRIEAQTHQAFHLEASPPWRLFLAKCGEKKHVLALTMHHILTDAQSFEVILGELAALYPAYRDGQTPYLPPLTVQYADFSVWQRACLTGAYLEEQVAWWRNQLANAPQRQTLPSDRRNPDRSSGRSARLRQTFPAETAAAFQVFCRQTGMTPFVVLQACLLTLLRGRLSQDDLVVGADVTSRSHAGTDTMIGFFVNQLVLRVRAQGQDTFSAFLGQVRETVLEAMRRQDLPFDKLVAELKPARHEGYAPFFQIKLNYGTLAKTSISLPGLDMELLETERSHAQLDLIANVFQTRDGYTLSLEYAADLYERDTIAALGRELTDILASVCENPEETLNGLNEKMRARAQSQKLEARQSQKASHRQRLVKRSRRGVAMRTKPKDEEAGN